MRGSGKAVSGGGGGGGGGLDEGKRITAAAAGTAQLMRAQSSVQSVIHRYRSFHRGWVYVKVEEGGGRSMLQINALNSRSLVRTSGVWSFMWDVANATDRLFVIMVDSSL